MLDTVPMAGERFDLAELEARIIERTIRPINNFKTDATVVGAAIGKQIIVWTVLKSKARPATVGANGVEYVVVGDVADQESRLTVADEDITDAAQTDLAPVDTNTPTIVLGRVVDGEIADKAVQDASAKIMVEANTLRTDNRRVR
jgi:hypothetical protein